MKNTTDLRNELVSVFKKVKSDKIEPSKARELVRVSNSILKTASLELDNQKLKGEKKGVEFLE